MADYLLAGDAISGKEGQVLATINDKVKICAEIKAITATIAKDKADFKALGFPGRGTQHKAIGWNGTGSVTFYYVTTDWAKMVIDYARTGKDIYFDMVVVNDDPGSSVGAQRIKLGLCNLDGSDIAKLDVDTDFLTGAFNFTFSSVEILTPFKNI